MPPKDSQNNSNPNFEPLKVAIDPVFGGNQGSSVNQINQTPSASAYNVLSNQQYVPNPQPPRPASTEQRTIPKASIRTYRDDVQSAIQANHLSSINIAMAENEKMHSKIKSNRSIEEESHSGGGSKTKIIFAIFLLVILVAVAGTGFYYFMNRTSSTENTSLTLTSFMTTEYSDELSINSVVKERFTNALSSRLNDIQIPVNNVYTAHITTGTSSAKRLVNTTEFIGLAGLQTPDSLKRNLTQDFMVGMFSFGQNLPFVIFRTSSFENTFSGLLEWEKDMERDFNILFRLNNPNGGGIAQSLTPLESRKFEDAVVVNQDVRVLRSADRKIVFLYAILNKDTIIITINEMAFKEILTRLNREKSLKR